MFCSPVSKLSTQQLALGHHPPPPHPASVPCLSLVSSLQTMYSPTHTCTPLPYPPNPTPLSIMPMQACPCSWLA
jgi:hypothetical protein